MSLVLIVVHTMLSGLNEKFGRINKEEIDNVRMDYRDNRGRRCWVARQ